MKNQPISPSELRHVHKLAQTRENSSDVFDPNPMPSRINVTSVCTAMIIPVCWARWA